MIDERVTDFLKDIADTALKIETALECAHEGECPEGILRQRMKASLADAMWIQCAVQDIQTVLKAEDERSEFDTVKKLTKSDTGREL